MANSTQKTLTKLCRSCGIQKPLSAFLQLSSQGGLIYGTICSTCRKINKDQTKATTIEESSSTTNAGHRIDAKLKVEADIKKKLLRAKREELYKKERDKKQLTQTISKQKVQSKAASEKKHREKYIKQGSVFNNKAGISKIDTNKKFFASERAKKTIDYTKPVPYIYIAGQIKHHSSVFKAMQAWLGKNNQFVKNIKKMGLAAQEPPTHGPNKKK